MPSIWCNWYCLSTVKNELYHLFDVIYVVCPLWRMNYELFHLFDVINIVSPLCYGGFFLSLFCCCDWGNCNELFISLGSFSAFAHLLTAYSLASAILFTNTFMHMYNFISCVIAKSSLFSTDCYSLLFIHLHIKIYTVIVQQAEAAFLWSQHEAMVMTVLSGVVWYIIMWHLYIKFQQFVAFTVCCSVSSLLQRLYEVAFGLFGCVFMSLNFYLLSSDKLCDFFFFIVTISFLFSIFTFLNKNY